MRKEIKNEIKNFTIEVIDFFLGIPEAIAAGFDRKEFYRAMNGMPTEKQLTYSNIAQLISNLKRHGYIEISEKVNGESIQFTNKAKLAVVDSLANRKVSDGRFYFISFDIPEYLRPNRDKFRRVIKKIGFKQIQKSLWVFNKSVGELVEIAAYEYEVEKYVIYIVSENTDIDGVIEKKFSEKSKLD